MKRERKVLLAKFLKEASRFQSQADHYIQSVGICPACRTGPDEGHTRECAYSDFVFALADYFDYEETSPKQMEDILP